MFLFVIVVIVVIVDRLSTTSSKNYAINTQDRVDHQPQTTSDEAEDADELDQRRVQLVARARRFFRRRRRRRKVPTRRRRGNVFRRVEERELLARRQVGLHAVGAEDGERGGRVEAELLDRCRRRPVGER